VAPAGAGRRLVAGAAVALVLVAPACGGGSGQRSRQTGSAVTGHVALRFSGAVSGPVDADTEVACFGPTEKGDRFAVSVDSDAGLPVGGRKLTAFDFSIPDYDGPRSYDLARKLETDDSFDGDDFLILFAEPADLPFLWGQGGSTGAVTVDKGGESGRLSLKGWKDSTGANLDVEGTFRCGRKAQP
jgi:hypothetical protein